MLNTYQCSSQYSPGKNFKIWLEDTSVVDPHHFNADPYLTCYPDAHPDSDFFLCGSGFLFDGDADLYPTFHPDADPDPDPDPSFQINSQTLEM